jgi:predicted HD phosphohydrolase
MVEMYRGRKIASYTRMDEGTKEDYDLLYEQAAPFKAKTADRVLEQLKALHHTFPGMKVDRYEHSLQTAQRAYDAGECEEIVVAALLHDIGDSMAPDNHGSMAAEMIKPYVSKNVHWMIKHHQIFQGYYFWDKVGKDPNTRDQFRDHPAFEMSERFCGEYDQTAFDPEYPTAAIEFFEPMVHRFYAREPWGAHSESEWPLDSTPANQKAAAE